MLDERRCYHGCYQNAGHHFPFAAGLSFAFFHRAAAAVRATTLRCSAVILVSRAFAPRLPSATAAGFFLFAISTMLSAQQKNSNYFLTCYALSIIVRTAMRKRAPKPKPETPAVDWRQAAEDRGRAAFEAVHAEPHPPAPEPPAWWESPAMTPEQLLIWQRKRQARAKKAVATAAKIRRDKERQHAKEEKQRAKENPPIKNQPKRHVEPYWPPDWALDLCKEQSMKNTSTNSTAPPNAMEKHYSLAQIAEAWGVSYATVWRMFRDMPGAADLSVRKTSQKSRSYRLLRIPESVVARVHAERANGFILGKRRK